jgi:hypothetical protein
MSKMYFWCQGGVLVLELARITGVDVTVLGEKCSGLKNLTLRDCNTLILENGGYTELLPGFSTLHHLAIHTKSDLSLMMYIPSHSFNVRDISIVTRSISVFNIENVLRRNQFHFLDELRGGQLPG